MSERLTQALQDLADDYSAAEVLAECTRLFVAIESTPARADDRQTSQASAARTSQRDVRRFQDGSLSARALRLFHDNDRTALEAAGIVADTLRNGRRAHSVESARKRVSDLVRAGYLRDTGRTRKNPGSPDESTVWTLTDSGLAAIACLNSKGWSK